MAEHFVNIYGTEKDKVNCPFYYKIGACRHGDRCSRVHNKPLFSQTIMFTNLYHSLSQIEEYSRQQSLPAPEISAADRRYHFDDFYRDIVEEMNRFGNVENIYVCANLSEHLAGNTYVKFTDEESAAKALKAMEGRYYAGVPVKVDYSPVTDFREGKCRPFEKHGKCDRGDYCHFMHLHKHQYFPDDYIQTRRSRSHQDDRNQDTRDERKRSRYHDYDRSYDYRRDSERHRGTRSPSREDRRERDSRRNSGRSFDTDDHRKGRNSRRSSYDRDGYKWDGSGGGRRRVRDTYKEYDYRKQS